MAISKKFFKYVLTSIAILSVAVIFGISYYQNNLLSFGFASKNQIVIVQFTDHYAIDDLRSGIIDKVLQNYGEYGISIRSAHGKHELMGQIARDLIQVKPMVVVAIGSTAAQALYPKIATKGVPVIFSNVADPIGTGLVDIHDENENTQGITGVSDFFDISKQLKIFLDIIPGIKTLGILYNPLEQSAMYFLEQSELSARSLGIEIRALPILSSKKIPQLALKLGSNIDAFMTMPNNISDAEMQEIVRIADMLKKPVLSSDVHGIDYGAVASVGVDMYAVGVATGEIVTKIISNINPDTIPVLTYDKITVHVNKAKILKFKK